MPKTDRLTKEIRFADEYLIDLNATEAYYRAGFTASTREVAGVSAHRLLKKPKVSKYITDRQSELRAKLQVTQESVIAEIARCGFANMQDYVTFTRDSVTLKDSSTLTREQLAAVSEVSQTVTKDGGSIRFRLHDKRGNLELLGKYLGLFVDVNVHHSGKVQIVEGLPD